MSWFSLIQAEKSVIHSHQFFNSTLTGNFIGEYAVKYILSNTLSYLSLRENASRYFSKKLCISLHSIGNDVTEKLLGRIIQGKTFRDIFPELFTHCHCKAQNPAFKAGNGQHLNKEMEAPEGGMTHLINHIFDQFLANDGNAFNSWIHAFEKGEEALELIAQKALIATLKPFCKKAIKASFKALVKTGIENTIDGACSSGISIIVISAIYRLALGMLCSAADFCRETPMSRTINFMQNYLPSPYKTLSVLSAIHLAEMGHVFWKTRHMNLKNTDLNKEQVKAFIIGIVKEPIKHALKDKELYKIMNLTFSEEKIENFIILLIKEMIDNHWDQLHQIRFLNMPLVT
ncbi:MAG TPA: hypothetical protein VGP47_03035 [Parachlamydiaceae bacterium]|nr:hypothetical protein [Parachlamydiaceae bacterium]